MVVNRSREGDGVGQAPVFDAWTPIGFKEALGNRRTSTGGGWLAPTWVGDHARRLQAYIILQAYIDNAGRFFLTEPDQSKRDQHREYGDANLIVETVRAALLGQEQTISVDGAEDFVENLPPSAPPEQQKASDEARPAKELQDWLEQWAIDERFGQKVIETERNSVGLGDGVFVLGWDSKKKRTRCRVYDPGFYFPVLEDGNEDEYPSRVHIAWEMAPVPEDSKRRIRRITWEVRSLPNGETRTYPWNDGPTSETCYMSDAVFVLDGAAPQTIDDMSRATPEWQLTPDGVQVRDLDLRIDFLPVVHLPNTVALQNHYGKSVLATILQVLDDIANADTDAQRAAGVAASPPIGLAGASMSSDTPLTYKPGQVWQLGDTGSLSTLEMSGAVVAILQYIDQLLKRLSVNSRTPEALLGRIDPSQVPSGITLRLSFGPIETMVREMRLVRAEKYPLLFKFVHRLAQAGGAQDLPAEYVDTEMVFGSFLPEDLAETVTLVTGLLTAKAISLETALQMLKESGISIEDILVEAQRIDGRNFEAANQLLDALGSQEEVAKFLGREGVEPDVAAPLPAVGTPSALPPAPNQPPTPPLQLPPAGGTTPPQP